MILHHLQLTQVRAIEEAEFHFEPGMNLLVGVNGVGKSTVLEALRILFSNIVPRITSDQSRPDDFTETDVTFGTDFLTAQCTISSRGGPHTFLMHNPLKPFIADPDREGEVRGQVIDTPARKEFLPFHPASLRMPPEDDLLRDENYNAVPLAVYFGPARSVVTRETPKRTGAYAEALSPGRRLRLREYANWWRTREALAKEKPTYRTQLDALSEAVSVFLDGCQVVGATNSDNPSLVLLKNGMELDAAQLSDGERGVLALVLDLTRRLAQANPALEDPAHEGQAVVLIDEIDLHLHPSWQRRIIHRLADTFPRCQFICTTHSPQTVSEVAPEAIQYLVWEDGRVVVKQHPQSYGLDTNWILEFLMDVPPQPAHIDQLLEKIDDAIDSGNFETARYMLEQLKTEMRGDSGEIARLEASLNTLEALADEDDSEEP